MAFPRIAVSSPLPVISPANAELDAVERGRGLQLADVAAIALGGAEVAV